MIIILLRLLLIQMTIQFDLAAILEGRTSHYVNLLDSNANDDTALRITCPVYTIRPANTTAKFIKYAASSAQFAVIEDWVEKDVPTFQECASEAALNASKMFFFDDGTCRMSPTLFIRLPETCGDDDATIVYMVEPDENMCASEYVWVNEGPLDDGPICHIFSASLRCQAGKIYGYDKVNSVVYFLNEDGCYSINIFGGSDFAFHKQDCGDKGKKSCKPADAESRAEFVQTLKGIAANADPGAGISNFFVDCQYDAGAAKFKWFGDIDQPENIPGEWESGSPSNAATAEYVYMTPTGLTNGADGESTQFCCFQPQPGR